MKKVIFLWSLFFCFVLMPFGLRAQTVTVSISLELTAVLPDQRGTDTRDAYQLRINLTGHRPSAGDVAVLYYLDDRPLKYFKNPQFPIVFTENFKGQAAGAHQLKVVLEDATEAVLATDTKTVVVQNE